MNHVEYWVSKDGKQFTDEFDCEKYELSYDLERSNLVVLGDDDHKYKGDSILSQHVYNISRMVYVTDEEALELIHRVQVFNGLYDGIDSCGIWQYKDEWERIFAL